MYKYEIIIYWSNEDRAFVAEAPELPGCMAHGDDQEAALRNIKDAMLFWIDSGSIAYPSPAVPKSRRAAIRWN